MQSSLNEAQRPRAPRSAKSRAGLLRAWFIAAAAYVLIAAAVSAGPVRSALRHAETLAAQPAPVASRPGGPIPEAPDSRATLIAKIAGGETLLLLGPPLLFLWLGWDIWFALVGFFPALHRAADPEPPPRER